MDVYDLALAARAAGDWVASERLLHTCCASPAHPRCADAYVLLAYTMYMQGDQFGASSMAFRAFDKSPVAEALMQWWSGRAHQSALPDTDPLVRGIKLLRAKDADDEARDCLLRAALSGSDLAGELLSTLLYNRFGDVQGAMEWTRRAAAAGFIDSRFRLGAAHLAGSDGVALDEERGLQLLRSAARGGHPGAALTVAELIYDRPGGDWAEAAQWLLVASRHTIDPPELLYGRLALTAYSSVRNCAMRLRELYAFGAADAKFPRCESLLVEARAVRALSNQRARSLVLLWLLANYATAPHECVVASLPRDVARLIARLVWEFRSDPVSVGVVWEFRD